MSHCNFTKHKNNHKQIDLDYLKIFRGNCGTLTNIYKLKGDTNKCPECDCQIYLGYFRHFNPILEDSHVKIKIPPNQTLIIFGRAVLPTYGGHALYFDPINFLIACGQCWSRRFYTPCLLENNTKCSISLSEFMENDQYMKCFQCKASFFNTCLKEWFETNPVKSCPNCRTPWTDDHIYVNLRPLEKQPNENDDN